VSDNATASLRACRFDDMKGVAAVTVHNNARLSCERASFRGCEMEEGLIEVFAGEATLTENTFAANRAKCAVRAWQSTDVRVKGSELRDNRGAGIVGIGANSIDIANCTLTGNEGDGIWMGEGTRFSILNNTVIRNGGHGLVAIKGSHGDITGNTIRQSSKNNVGLDDESRELINTTALITRNEIEF
jgi:parallel beta-helix repeat protein